MHAVLNHIWHRTVMWLAFVVFALCVAIFTGQSIADGSQVPTVDGAPVCRSVDQWKAVVAEQNAPYEIDYFIDVSGAEAAAYINEMAAVPYPQMRIFNLDHENGGVLADRFIAARSKDDSGAYFRGSAVGAFSGGCLAAAGVMERLFVEKLAQGS